MDQKVNDTDLKHNNRTPVRFRVVQSNLPGQEDTYSATVVRRDTLTIDDLIRRIMEKRSELRPETLRTVFSLIKNELYEALEDGYNVDFEFGRVDVTLGGAFVHPSDRYDGNTHLLQPRLNPSPLMKQRVARLKGINDTYNASRNGLQLEYITSPMPASRSPPAKQATATSSRPTSKGCCPSMAATSASVETIRPTASPSIAKRRVKPIPSAPTNCYTIPPRASSSAPPSPSPKAPGL